MAQKPSLGRRRPGSSSRAMHDEMPATEYFTGRGPVQPVFPQREFPSPLPEDPLPAMMKDRGWFSQDSSGQRRKKSEEGEDAHSVKMASSSNPTSVCSRHTDNEQGVGSDNQRSKSIADRIDSTYNGQKTPGFVVKMEPGVDNSHLSSWHPEVFNSSFWTPLASDEGSDLNKGHVHNLKYQKAGKRGHNSNSLGHGSDPLGFLRNPSWHDRNLPEQDRELGENPGVQLFEYTSEHVEGKQPVCERRNSKESSDDQSLEPGEIRWPPEKAAGGGGAVMTNEEEEEEDLFHPPVHFDPHQQQKRASDQQPGGSPQWEEGELPVMGEDMQLCEEDDLSQFPMSTFRARLDETKCHKRKMSTPANAIVPTVGPDHVCPHCNVCFVDANNLKRHVAYIHSDKIEEDRKAHKRKRQCDECGKTFDRPSRLERHRVIHSGEKPFVCEICNKAFSRASNLKIHQHLHSGRKPFVCDVCDKAFSDGGKLKKHQVIHTGDKPFVCDICHKGFAETGNLKRHKKYHIGHKAFACDVCGKAFIESGMLRRHKVQTNHNPIICFVCNRSFLLSEHLDEHTKVHTLSGDASGIEDGDTKP